jgi:hypothetical protein
VKTIENTDYVPSATWNQFLQNLSWQRDAHINSACQAFKEAIRRGLSRSDVFFDVAEAIHRSYCAVNWGVLNWKWKLALQDSDRDGGCLIQVPTLKPPPLQPTFQRSLPVAKGNGAPDHRGQRNGIPHPNANEHHNWHNGPKQRQRGGSSLVSYYA